jgi:succinate dehydrogenase / fumarate reductase iron-sulfur subunit
MASTRETIVLKVKRQEGPGKPARWEEFSLPYKPNMNIISCLMEVQKNPVNAQAQPSTPVVWDCSCLEHVCGACSMVINGKARQSCSTLVDQLEPGPIQLEPLSKFPVVRDLKVDRSRLFEDLKKAKAWIPIDGTYSMGPGPRVDQATTDLRYKLSTCMSCAVCMESCPQYNERSPFIGPAVLNQVRLMNLHPTGKLNKDERLEAIMGDGGITDCGNAQNCVKACPKEIPLTESIGDLGWQTTVHGLFGWLKS